MEHTDKIESIDEVYDAAEEVSSSEGLTNILKHMPPGEMLVTGVVTGLAVSAITQTGRNVMGKLIRNPLVMLGLGIAAGVTLHKYRKEILASGRGIAEKGRDFALRQRENLEDLLAESKEAAEDAGE
jgi:hypothetical protein